MNFFATQVNITLQRLLKKLLQIEGDNEQNAKQIRREIINKYSWIRRVVTIS